jgi:transposase
MLIRRMRAGKCVNFAPPPWPESSSQWQALDEELPADHPARRVVEQMHALDLSALEASYLGTGSPPYRPDLMLRIALIEIQSGRHSPSQWFRDNRENKALQWAGLGIRPSRTCWHQFYDRAAPFLLAWNRQVLEAAQQEGQTTATRAAQDGSLVGANASRHRLLNSERLQKRLGQLQQQIVNDQAAAPPSTPEATAEPTPTAQPIPGWMATTPNGRQAQQQRYEKAQEHLHERLDANARRNPAKRQDPKKVVISVGDPEAVPGRDKEKVYRPLYNVQLVCDLDSPFFLGYEVFAQSSDSGTLEPMLERTADLTGRKPETLLADAGYVTGADLALCAAAGVALYGPWLENDYTKKDEKHLGKDQFVWLSEENAYRCPQGHRLTPIGKERRFHVDGRSEMQYRYRCAPVNCRTCPLREACTSNPERGRSLRRSEYEDLITEHKTRMQTPEAKQLYKLRKQTVELGFADLKEHRKIRRFWGRGMARAQAQVGFAVLSHNLFALTVSPAGEENQPTEAANAGGERQ